MEFKKLLLSLSCVVALSFTFASCSDDDDDTLSYRETKVSVFKMYVGSPSGGVEVNTTNLDVKDILHMKLKIWRMNMIYSAHLLVEINFLHTEMENIKDLQSIKLRMVRFMSIAGLKTKMVMTLKLGFRSLSEIATAFVL